MTTAFDIITGTAVEAVIVAAALALIYRIWRNTSFLPQRKAIAPFNRGVILRGEQPVRVVDSGRFWLLPKESLVAVDIRPKPVQIPSHDLLTLDNQAVRVALAGEFRVADPARYVCENSNSGGAFFLALEQALPLAVAEYSLDALLRNPSVLAKRIQERVEPRAAQLGLKLTTLEVLNALALYVKSPAE